MIKHVKHKWRLGLALCLVLGLGVALCYQPRVSRDCQAGLAAQPASEELAAEQEVAFSPLLHWPENPLAVVYELELFTQAPTNLPLDNISDQAAYRTRAIYMNYFNPPLRELATEIGIDDFHFDALFDAFLQNPQFIVIIRRNSPRTAVNH